MQNNRLNFKRIFIAINLPSSIKERIVYLQNRLVRLDLPVRWTKKENLHLTLVFLGEIDEVRIEKTKRITREVVSQYNTFKLKLQGLGSFPDERNPRILWVGLEDSGDLGKLQKDLVDNLRKNHLRIDDKKFWPHLTIGRTKRKIQNFQDVKNKLGRVDLGEFEFEAVELMESELTDQGPIYKVIEKINLKC